MWHLRDQTGVRALSLSSEEKLERQYSYWAFIEKTASGWTLLFNRKLAAPKPFQGDDSTFSILKLRFEALRRVRSFFTEHEFCEVDTPVRVPCPSMEPYLDAFKSGSKSLRTSPELHMKRLLCGGWDRIFQIASSFRNEPESTTHQQEFLMLEWYRAFSNLNTLIEDIQGLLQTLAPLAKDSGYFRRSVRITDMPDLFNRKTGIDLTIPGSRKAMENLLGKNQLSAGSEDSWDDLFFKVFLNFIEPDLGRNEPEIILDYPASQSALARINPVKNGAYESCYRFELFIKGVECANAYDELTDAEEQDRRFLTCNEERLSMGKEPHPADETFFKAMHRAMPPASGIALGLDRIIMLLAGEEDIRKVMPHYQYN
jgi:lysyl-tRNA synthetase class 2